jgi:uncharacterized SAM-binding protein YcdF (DUF218 family)
MPFFTAKRVLAGILLAFVMAAVALVYGISRAGYWLQAAAQTPIHADAIIVLGGNDGDRALRALGLYKEGYAPKIVLTGLERGRASPPANLQWRAEYLAARGVPKSALRFEIYSENSYEEAENILDLMKKQGWRTVIAVSDPPHMRRLAWTWHRVFKGSGLSYALVASAAQWWMPGDWWRDEHSGAFVITEYIKIAYYLAKR